MDTETSSIVGSTIDPFSEQKIFKEKYFLYIFIKIQRINNEKNQL